MASNEERVMKVVSDKFGVYPPEVTVESRFVEDLGADEADLVSFVMSLEEEFNIQIPDDAAEKFIRVGDVNVYMDDHVI